MADLITLTRAKLGIPSATSSDDAWLEALIDAASTAIENWCGRTFALTSYFELADGKQDGCIVLANYPVTNIYQIHTGYDAMLRVRAGTGLGTTFFTPQVSVNPSADLSPDVTFLRNTTTSPAVTTYGTGLGENTNMTLMAAAINADGVYEAEVISGYASHPTVLFRLQGPKTISREWSTLDAWSTQSAYTDADFPAGMIFGDFPAGRNTVRVYYAAGYSTIPEDIQQACVELVRTMFESGQVSSILHRERLGDYSYQLKESAAAMVYSLPPNVFALLAPYRSRRVLA